MNYKETWITFLLWFFFGSIGAHRYYTNHHRSAVTMTILFVCGITAPISIIWAIIDIFRLRSLTAEANNLIMKGCIYR